MVKSSSLTLDVLFSVGNILITSSILILVTLSVTLEFKSTKDSLISFTFKLWNSLSLGVLSIDVISSLSISFCGSNNVSYLLLNFSSNTLYVSVLKVLSYFWNSSTTVSLCSLTTGFSDKCYRIVSLWDISKSGLENSLFALISVSM